MVKGSQPGTYDRPIEISDSDDGSDNGQNTPSFVNLAQDESIPDGTQFHKKRKKIQSKSPIAPRGVNSTSGDRDDNDEEVRLSQQLQRSADKVLEISVISNNISPRRAIDTKKSSSKRPADSQPLEKGRKIQKRMQGSAAGEAPDPSHRKGSLALLSLSEIDRILKRWKRVVEDEHASLVQSPLVKAQNQVKASPYTRAKFIDEEVPFGRMSPIPIEKEKISSFKKLSQSTTRVPKYKDYVAISRSLLVADSCRLDFRPYLEGATEEWTEDSNDQYREVKYAEAFRREERLQKIYGYLPRILDDVGLNFADILSAGTDASRPGSIATNFLAALERNFKVTQKDLHLEIQKNHPMHVNSSQPSIVTPELPGKALLGPHLLSCPQCHVYACGVHGEYESDGEDSSDDEDEEDENSGTGHFKTQYADLNMQYSSILQLQRDNFVPKHPSEKIIPCSNDCFSNDGNITGLGNRLNEEDPSDWTKEDLSYLQAFILGVEHEPKASCTLSLLLGKSCREVHRQVLLQNFIPPIPRHRELEKLDWYDNRKKEMRRHDWMQKTKDYMHSENRQPMGCEHNGLSCLEAKDLCGCVREKTLCGKFCACPNDCCVKFTGCSCAKTGRSCGDGSQKCLCVLLGRECDPDLCDSCGAGESTVPHSFTNEPLNPSSKCLNVAIQVGISKTLLVGKSSHPGAIGFGAYLAEPVKKGEYISEYVGEIISNGEAERRAVMYNKLEISYLFDLNSDMVIDSYRYGNTTRFINHAKKNANCHPMVKLVNGEHRIGFYANKNLPSGAELFFDYGQKFASVHGLVDMAIDVRPRKIKVAEPIEDLDAEPVVPLNDGDDDHTSEYEEMIAPQESNRFGRPKRNARRPAKYTA